MFTKVGNPALWLASITIALLLGFGLATLARLAPPPGGAPPTPTSIAPTAPPTEIVPTSVPTAQPTSLPPTAQPTSVPTAQPTIGLSPQVGGPGTYVEVSGGGYQPGAWYVIRLGLPQPMGEVLLSVQAAANGTLAGSLIMPASVPSGAPIASGEIFLVAMNDQNIALASAPFAYNAAAAYPQTPQEVVTALLNTHTYGGDMRPFLGQQLIDRLNETEDYAALLGLHPIELHSFSFGEPYSYPAADLAFLPVTLSYEGFNEERVYMTGIDYADPIVLRAKIYGSELAREGHALATGPEDAANRFLLEIWADRSGRRAMPYLAGALRDQLARGEQVDLLEQGGVGPLHALNSFAIGAVIAEDETFKWVEIRLELEGQGSVTRFAKVQQLDGVWLVVGVINTLAGEPPPSAFPGPGWSAWKSGDFNGDGIEETVYLKETSLVCNDRLADPLLNSTSLNATALLVVQAAAHGPWVLLEIDSLSARAADGQSYPFTSAASPSGPAFFQVAVTYADAGRFLHLLPLKGDGYAYTQAMVFGWDTAASAYRLVWPQ